jgi:hypothetical protein
MQNVYIKTCVLYIKTERMNPHQKSDRPLASGQEVRVRFAEWVPPVGGALSGHTSTWQVQAAGVHRPSDRRGRVVPRSKQPRRYQAAEGSRRSGAHTPGGKNTPF